MATETFAFVSSKMVELAPERKVIDDLLPTLDSTLINLRAWVFEKHAPASEKTIRDVYLKALQNSALYIGLFWNDYGEWTIDEFDRATEWGIDRHIYVKDVDANKRDPRLAEFLNKISNVPSGVTPKWFTTEKELLEKVQASLAIWVQERLTKQTSAQASLIKNTNDLDRRPRKLFGRDDLIHKAVKILETGEPLLLQGFSGIGKTALAAEIAASIIETTHKPILWLQIGNGSADTVFEALSHPVNMHREVAAALGDAKSQIIRTAIRTSDAGLIVLDDAWSSDTLNTVLRVLPRDIPVLVTSRQRYPMDNILEVDELKPNDAVELLKFHTKHEYDPHMFLLCEKLGNHPFAIEVAGKTIKTRKCSVYEMLKDIADAPHELKVPLGYSEKERGSMKNLLDTSVKALPDDETRNTFFAIGAFWSTNITAQMLGLYFVNRPHISEEEIAEFRSNNPHANEMSDEKVVRIMQDIMAYIEGEETQKRLNVLHDFGLMERITNNDEFIAHYRIHSLAFSYIRAYSHDLDHDKSLNACATYVLTHHNPLPECFAALRPELNNFLGASNYARRLGYDREAEILATYLYAEGSEFLDYGGYYSYAKIIIENAYQAAVKSKNKQRQAVHLNHLGLVYGHLGLFTRAVEYHQQALQTARQIKDHANESGCLTNLGFSYLSLGNHKKALRYHTQALRISRQLGNTERTGAILSNIGNVYTVLEEWDKATKYHAEALAIAYELDDLRSQQIALGNLGNDHMGLKQYEDALHCFLVALDMSRHIEDQEGISRHLLNLGSLHVHLEKLEIAHKFYQESLVITREIGNRRREGLCLTNLGAISLMQKDFIQALSLYSQARSVFLDIELYNEIAKVDQIIIEAQEKLSN